MAKSLNDSLCGLPIRIVIPRNDTAAYTNEVLVAIANAPFCVFAFLTNLAIIATVIKTPSLKTPLNILLCGLAVTDSLTGLIVQPLFVVHRLMLHRAQLSCAYQLELHAMHLLSIRFMVGWSFLSLVVISFDRHYALSKPLLYRANATAQGAVKATVGVGILRGLEVVVSHFLLPKLITFTIDRIIVVLIVVAISVNHVGMYLSVRKQQNQLVNAVAAQQVSDVFRREKRVAMSMFIVTIIVVLSLVPGFMVSAFVSKPLADYLIPWALTFALINSSINPLFFLRRNKDLKNAMKSFLPL